MSLIDVPLFDLASGAIVAQAAEPAAKLKPDQARALRQAAAMQRGMHPLGSKLHPDAADGRTGEGLRCRGCVHVTTQGYTSGRYLKCDAHTITRGPGTDLRLWWPACERYEAKEA